LPDLFASPGEFARARVVDGLATLRQDLGCIREGYFKFPYDMSPQHRQWSPFFVARKGLSYLQEATRTLERASSHANTSTWLRHDSDIYPPYYLHTFHYQTDGWLSSKSAEVYETSTETMFLGRQDAMQRTTLVHIAKHLRGRELEPTRLLEVACGTGRFMTFMRDNLPSIDMTALDLSPFYLEEARRNNRYWERRFAPADGTKLGKATFVQANAEAMPFAVNSFDIVVSVYLFHELPADAQDAVVAEVARVLAPGGIFVLTDSLQLGDRPLRDEAISNFGNFAEPYYEAYIRRDLAELARTHGLEPVSKEVSSATKSLLFTKPARVDELPSKDA